MSYRILFVLAATLALNAAAQNAPTKYEKLRIEAHKKYQQKDKEDFRRKVNESFQEKQREHGEYALIINKAEANRPLVQRSDDKLLVEEPLYDNAAMQQYVNRIGQSLVPASSQQLYAFRVTLNPYPEARALSNGTIYLSTGLLALLANEAQLAYVLSHEIAHIEHNHWFEDVMIEQMVRARNQRKLTAANIVQKTSSNLVRAFTGWFNVDPLLFRMYDSFGAASLAKAAFPRTKVTWDKAQEDESDRLALKLMQARGYDVREATGFYAQLKNAGKSESQTESLMQQSFTASSARADERVALLEREFAAFTVNQQTAQRQLAATLAKPSRPGKALLADRQLKLTLTPQQDAELKKQIAQRALLTNTTQFNEMLALVKRDNGIRAFHYDLFSLARLQLDEAVKLRSNDALARYYKGRVWQLTARTSEEKQIAANELSRAAALDVRRQYPEICAQRSVAGEPTNDKVTHRSRLR